MYVCLMSVLCPLPLQLKLKKSAGGQVHGELGVPQWGRSVVSRIYIGVFFAFFYIGTTSPTRQEVCLSVPRMKNFFNKLCIVTKKYFLFCGIRSSSGKARGCFTNTALFNWVYICSVILFQFFSCPEQFQKSHGWSVGPSKNCDETYLCQRNT